MILKYKINIRQSYICIFLAVELLLNWLFACGELQRILVLELSFYLMHRRREEGILSTKSIEVFLKAMNL